MNNTRGLPILLRGTPSECGSYLFLAPHQVVWVTFDGRKAVLYFGNVGNRQEKELFSMDYFV